MIPPLPVLVGTGAAVTRIANRLEIIGFQRLPERIWRGLGRGGWQAHPTTTPDFKKLTSRTISLLSFWQPNRRCSGRPIRGVAPIGGEEAEGACRHHAVVLRKEILTTFQTRR